MTRRKIYYMGLIIILVLSFGACSYKKEGSVNAADNTKDSMDKQEYESDIENMGAINGIADNETISSTSPNGAYTIEMYGTDRNITAGGLYPYKAMHLISWNDSSFKWIRDSGYYSADFVWSDDSRYVAVNGTARDYGESFILDARRGAEITLPEYEMLSSYCDDFSNLNSVYSSFYFSVSGWKDNHTAVVEVRGIPGVDREEIAATFTYDILSRTLLNYQNNEISNGNAAESDEAEKVEPIIWYADITQDGIDEKIVVDLTYVLNYPKTGEEQTVSVYSGSTGGLLWTGHADTVHPGWNGIYIYNDGKQDYLLLWQPTVYQGSADFRLRIFSLDEAGKEIELLTKNMQFVVYHLKDGDTEAISEFVDMVNGYLEKSFVLVDTNNGIPVYSTKDNKIINLYDISWILER